MKIAALFSVLVIATAADECTTDDLTTISKVYSSAMTDGTAACPDLATTSDTTDYCSYTACLGYMSDMLDKLPDCSSGGVSIKKSVKAAIDYCKTGTADTSNVLTGSAFSTNSLLRTSSPSTDSATSDKLTGNAVPPASGGSSSASSIGVAISSVAFAVTASICAFGL